MTYRQIAPEELHRMLGSGMGIDLIDVRTPSEFAAVHVNEARNEPVDTLDVTRVLSSRIGAPDSSVYVMCKSGARARQACDRFLAAGHDNVVLVDGSMESWLAAGLPVVRGRKAMPLDCQTRIAIGTMVLTGVAMGVLIHPAFLAISAFAGLGLIMAGITDNCPLANVIARMPWNRGVASSCCVNISRTR